MDDTAASPKTFDEFKHFIAGILLVPEEKLTPETSFTDDLYVDSLKLVEMATRREKGFRYNCDKYFVQGHHCKTR